MKKRIKSLIISLVIGFSLVATPAWSEVDSKDNYWQRCLNSFHIMYEAVFATADREWIQYIYNKYGKPAPAKIVGGINGETLDIRIDNACGKLDYSCITKHRCDSIYRLTTVEEMKRFLEFDDTDKLQYIPDYRDCDDYARLLVARVQRWTPGLAFGYITVMEGRHAVNIFIDVNHDVWYIEPQSDFIKLLEPDDDVSFIFLEEDKESINND